MNRRFRLTRSADFKRVRRLGTSFAHPLIVLILLPNELEQPRIAVAASRHVGKAVKRNRAKRLIRAALHPLITSITPGWDILLIARRPMTEATIQETEQALLNLLIRAQLITEPHVN
ncbi:MAG: ribonuclease P protein component [Anaerolineales bacterium]|nr:ribonuclease P protein component [Anaerolineales bacterium]